MIKNHNEIYCLGNIPGGLAISRKVGQGLRFTLNGFSFDVIVAARKGGATRLTIKAPRNLVSVERISYVPIKKEIPTT